MTAMKLFTFALLIAALAATGARAQSPELGPAEVQIELRPHVAAPQRELLLGDIAIVRTRDLLAIQQLVALPIGRAPRPGTDAVLRRDAIARWIRTQLGLAHSRTLWTGGGETLVRGIGSGTKDIELNRPANDPSRQAVARGEWVVLQLKAGPVELERRAQAMQDGKVGETVNVRAESGPVAARITAPGRVEATL